MSSHYDRVGWVEGRKTSVRISRWYMNEDKTGRKDGNVLMATWSGITMDYLECSTW